MRKINHFLTTLLFAFLISFTLHAKKGDKVDGYIIKNDDTRIEGKIMIGSITDNEVKVVFYKKGQSKKIIYKPNDIKAYGYEAIEVNDVGTKQKRWIHFERQKVDYPPKPFGPKTVFMEREEQGELTLFCYYIEVRNNPKQPYRYEYYIKDEAGKTHKLTREKFYKEAKGIFKKYSALSTRIGQKQFNYRNLERMVRDYNFWTVNRHDKNEYRVALKEN